MFPRPTSVSRSVPWQVPLFAKGGALGPVLAVTHCDVSYRLHKIIAQHQSEVLNMLRVDMLVIALCLGVLMLQGVSGKL